LPPHSSWAPAFGVRTLRQPFDARSGLVFVIAFGIVSLFADMTYEGMRAISGPFLASLGAIGFAVGLIGGTSGLAGYALRLFSGRAADSTRLYWPITLTGYFLQMAAVPALAVAGNWQVAALLIVLERAGKAIRNPPRDVMLSRAGEHIGQGWAFGLHEALDQTGAVLGPLAAALVLTLRHDYREAFAWLAVPAAITLVLVVGVRISYSAAGHIAAEQTAERGNISPAFKSYAVAIALVAFGFADYSLIAFHFARAGTVPPSWIPLLYALAMGTAGAASLGFGRWYDRRGLWVLLPATLLGVLVAPLVFLGGFWMALAGTALWGNALGVQESVMSAAIADMVPLGGRARAYGLFTAIFGIAWFAGSAVMGFLYDKSLPALAILSVTVTLAALIPLTLAIRARRAEA
jgi:predicted MFS family arabinose efflux permease